MKTLEIQVPEGYEIDQEKSTFEKIVFKEIAKEQLPRIWSELNQVNGFFVNSTSKVSAFYQDSTKETSTNTFTTAELAKSSIALAMYSQLKQHYANDIEAFVPIHKDYEKALKPIFELFHGKEWRAAYYLGLLIQLRDSYNDKIELCTDVVYSLYYCQDSIMSADSVTKYVLSFYDENDRDTFRGKYQDLIKLASSLL